MVRGRLWIPLLGVLLVGIVGMQVEILKLNAGLGRSIERTTALQSRDDALRSTVATLSDTQRIESIAARHGMVMAPPGAVKLLAPASAARSADVRRAAAGIRQPGSVAFVAPLDSSPTAPATGSSASPIGG